MNVDKIISTLPTKSGPERKAVRDNAERWLRSAKSDQRESAQAVLTALEELERQETGALVEHVAALPKAKRAA